VYVVLPSAEGLEGFRRVSTEGAADGPPDLLRLRPLLEVRRRPHRHSSGPLGDIEPIGAVKERALAAGWTWKRGHGWRRPGEGWVSGT
jgi:hypothetical protein